jgi:hypothetical protein
MTAVLRIRGDYYDQYVREDSTALLKKKIAGIGGDTIVEIKRGKGAPKPYEGAKSRPRATPSCSTRCWGRSRR